MAYPGRDSEGAERSGGAGKWEREGAEAEAEAWWAGGGLWAVAKRRGNGPGVCTRVRARPCRRKEFCDVPHQT